MKNNLIYQTSEYDCGPTTLINAVRFLFEREQVTPELLQHIYMFTLDAYNDAGENGKSGTSAMAMQFLSHWFNQYGEKRKFPIYSRFLAGEEVSAGPNSEITSCLQQGGVAAVWVWLGGEGHYVLLVQAQEEKIGLFDPYYIENYPDDAYVKTIHDMPEKMNRMVDFRRLNETGMSDYALGEKDNREAMLIYNTQTRKTPDNSIEYVI